MRPTTHLLAVLLGFVVQTSAPADIIHVPADHASIQGAIDAATDGDEIIVDDGVYTGPGNRDLNYGGKLITLRSANGPEGCIIDCQAEWPDVHRAFIFMSGETELAVVDGFTITNCLASFFEPGPYCDVIGDGGGDPAFDAGGGGMLCLGSSPTVKNCVFEQNGGGFVGGGMYNCNSHPRIVNCTFSNNTAAVGAGMANVDGSHPTITDSTFKDNHAASTSFIFAGGGGMYNMGSSPIVANCTFARNSAVGTAPGLGGGMANCGSSPTVTNSTFSGNAISFGVGGGMGNSGSSPTVTNCTFSGNRSNPGGGGMHNYHPSSPTVTNSIVWGNTDPQITGSSTTVSYSDIEGGWYGEGNIDADPLFVDPGFWDDNGTPENPDDDFWVEGDYRLSAGSPCIDAADSSTVPPDIETDLDGNPRFVDDPLTPDIGAGDCPIVDMGAYEFQDGNADCCPADLDGDGAVGASDLAELLGNWGPCEGCPADLDGNGQVGPFDLALLLGAWGECE